MVTPATEVDGLAPDDAGELAPGDHLCWFFDDDQQLAAVAEFARAGLAQRQKVLWYTDTLLPEALAAGLEHLGVSADEAAARGQLRIATVEDTYLASGRFDPAATIAGWRAEIETAKAQGWTGLRVVGDMAWAARRVPGSEHLARYEAQVNRVFAGGYAVGICLYDRRLYTATELGLLASAHPATAPCPGTAGWPLLRMRHTTDPPGLRLVGEVDMSNRHAVSAVLAGLTADLGAADRELVVDVSGLRFIDAATAAALARTAAAVPAGLRVVECSRPLARMLRLVARDTSPLLVEEAV